ncbi:MAG: baseplate J/gp47 family protein [Armatimonadota bacterium]
MAQAKRGRLPYVNKDYESIREELMSRIPQLTDRWTDFNASDLGVVLLELFAGIADMLAYYIDAQAAECYLPTARQRQNIINLCSLIDYSLHGPVASTTTLRFTLKESQADDIVIPAGTLVRAPDANTPVPFVTTAGLTIKAGATEAETNAVQGEAVTESFTGTGQQMARITLARTDIAEGTVKVVVASVEWQEVEHFTDSGAENTHFRVERDGLDRVSIIFGDGKWGTFPRQGATIDVSYLATLGPDGNLAPHRVTEIISYIYTSGNELVQLTVDNPLPATGGSERESADHAKETAPAVLRSTWKAVTRDDYTALCLAFPGIAKARVMDINDDPNLRIYTVRICIAPDGGGLPSPLLKEHLESYLDARRLLTIDAGIVDPAYIPVNVSALLYTYPGQDIQVVKKRALEVLESQFAFEGQDFGSPVYLSDLVALLDGVEGVSHVVLREPMKDVTSGFREIPTLGTVTIDTQVVR